MPLWVQPQAEDCSNWCIGALLSAFMLPKPIAETARIRYRAYAQGETLAIQFSNFTFQNALVAKT